MIVGTLCPVSYTHLDVYKRQVLGGLLLSPYVWWIDSALGILISVLLFYAAYGIIREAVNKILGESCSSLPFL